VKTFFALREANDTCPIATHNLDVNVKNRQVAIDKYTYGPANPEEPGIFFNRIADMWDIPVEQAKTMRCGNCAAFIQTPKMMACISGGLEKDEEGLSYDQNFIKAADLGYCDLFQFTCAAARTCDAWKGGGPITKEKA
jgi:hypothetical protein